MQSRMNTLTARFPLAGQFPLSALDMVTKALSIWRERQHLQELDAHRLSDLGLTRTDVEIETNRPVWDAPNRWRG